MLRRLVSAASEKLCPDVRSWIENCGKWEAALWVAVLSGVSLFFELAVIRWQASTFFVFSFYKNVSLLSIFLGLGVGFAIGTKKAVRPQTLLYGTFFQCVFFFALKAFGLHHLFQNPVAEIHAMGLGYVSALSQRALTIAFLTFVFLYNAAITMGMGQFVGGLMGRQPKLKAYGLNLLGSIVGVLAFTLMSWLWSPPLMWFSICLGLLAFSLLRARALPGWALTSLILFLALVDFDPKTNRYHLYSPYQDVFVMPTNNEARVVLSLNGLYTQNIFDLSPANRAKNPGLNLLAGHYDAPYKFRKNPGRVLIVGAGTGNDVAAALRAGATHVDAVEIDPVIQTLGKQFHPEQPYQDPRVTAHVNDARTFLKQSNEKYDMIVYGLLDSQTVLSNMSNVRLDSFVYTVEAFRESRKHLSENGVFALTFCMVKAGIGKKIFEMLKLAFDGKLPFALETGYDGGILFVATQGERPTALPSTVKDVTSQMIAYSSPVSLSTDDWPFLYMETRQYPTSYLTLIGILALASGLFIRRRLRFLTLSKENREIYHLGALFFMGAAFMLIETRSITELGLVFGNTWQVIALVICSILLMAGLSNAVVDRYGSLPSGVVFAGIAGSLGLGWYLNVSGFGLSPLVAATVASLPLFFSGFLFSSELSRTKDIGAALGANLFGSMCGGFLEYNSLYLGFRSLYALSLALYTLSIVCIWVQAYRAMPLSELSTAEVNGSSRSGEL